MTEIDIVDTRLRAHAIRALMRAARLRRLGRATYIATPIAASDRRGIVLLDRERLIVDATLRRRRANFWAIERRRTVTARESGRGNRGGRCKQQCGDEFRLHGDLRKLQSMDAVSRLEPNRLRRTGFNSS